MKDITLMESSFAKKTKNKTKQETNKETKKSNKHWYSQVDCSEL